MGDCDHPHDQRRGLKGAALSAALRRAEARCDATGHRLTPIRRQTLDLLLRAGVPMKAYDLIGAYGRGGAVTKPPTIYRALDFLTQRGLVHRIESLNAFTACDVDEADHAAAFVICDCCGAAAEVEPPAAESLRASAAAAGYQVKHVTVEAHGFCPECAPKT